MELSYFQKINNSYKTLSYQESDLYDLKQEINDGFEKTIDYHSVLKRDNTKQDLLIIHDRNKQKKLIKSRPDEIIKNGECYIWNDCNWLTIEVDLDSQIYTSATIQRCNYTLPFQTDSSTIYNEPCIVESNQSSDGESSNKIITVPDNIKFILIQYNENTKKLVEDKRIIIDTVREKPMVYKITNIDTVTKMDGENGLWKLTCKADGSFNPETDNKDLKICNYISSTDIPTPPTPSIGDCCITYKNVATIKIGGTEKPFNVIYKDSNGIDITSTLTSVWSIQVPVGFENDIHFTPKDNLCGLRAEDNEDLIGKTITLNVKSSDGAYSGSLNVKVVSLYG